MVLAQQTTAVDWPRGSLLGKVKSPTSTQAHLSLLPLSVPPLAVTDTSNKRYSYMHTLIINVNPSAWQERAKWYRRVTVDVSNVITHNNIC